MASRRAIIGTVVGSAILAIGIASLIINISNFGLREFVVDDTYPAGDPILPFTLRAPAGTVQSLSVTAESFETELRQGNQTRTESHEGGAELQWTHGQEGASSLSVTNTGPGGARITGTLYSETEWILVTYDFFVMISGLIIIGFSAGFGKRRPRGF